MMLKNKVTIVTGAGRGIGAATATKFAKEGSHLVLVDLHQEKLDKVKSVLSNFRVDILTITSNVADRSQVQNLINQTMEHFGQIDIVINNAGIVKDAQLLKMTESQWDDVIDVNLKGVFNVSQAAAAIMKEQGSGVILNASSIVGIYGNFGQTNYAATKWGVNGMTKTWAKELGKYGIRVNSIAPGFIETDMITAMPEHIKTAMKAKSPLNKMGTVDDIANGYAFLASDDAKFITGTILSIDGGLVL